MRITALFFLSLALIAPATAQQVDPEAENLPALPLPPETGPGKVAKSAVGQVGQRQQRGDVTHSPMARIESRIENRVQSRLRSRIDGNYDPQFNAESPFKAAGDNAHRADQGRH